MKNLTTLLLIVLIMVCFGCNEKGYDWDSEPKTTDLIAKSNRQNDTIMRLSIHRGELQYHLKWQEWLSKRRDKLNVLLERDAVGFLKLPNYEQAVLLRNQVRRIIEIYNEDVPEIPVHPYQPSPKPSSPLPDTSKPIKDKIKMQPRWREDSIHVQPTVYYPNDSLIWVRPTDSSGWIILSQYEKWTSKVDTTLIYEGTDIPEWELQVSDTQKVIMLVADTSSQNGFRSSRCFWMFGYVIQEQKVLLPSMPPYMTYNETVGYLDDRHLPLPKNIVVWMSKELK